MSQGDARQPRADARRNRERILEAARELFTREGAEVSLDEVARVAGVGPGTLYRHFPGREALLEAVYRSGVEKLGEAEREFARTLEPMEALRAWLLLFVEYMAAKQILAPALKTMLGSSAEVFAYSGMQIKESAGALVARAVESGELRGDVEPLDLVRGLVGAVQVSAGEEGLASARRLVEVLLRGARV